MPQLNLSLMDYMFNLIYFFLFCNYFLTILFLIDDDLLSYNKLVLV